MAQTLNERFNKFKKVYLMEKHRKDSFQKWPYDEKSDCSISKMAEAGFYWSGKNADDDTATCFVCGKTLHGWDPTDDPWKEHVKHAPQCQFVKYGHKELEMTTEEFLNIFSTVITNKLVKNMNEIKTRFEKQGAEELEKYLLEKMA